MATLCPPEVDYAMQISSPLLLLWENELPMQAQGLFAQNGYCSPAHTGLCYAAMNAGRPFASENREVFRGIDNFFLQCQISY